MVDVAVLEVAADEAALPAVAHADGPALGGAPLPGFAAQVERFALVGDGVGHGAGVAGDHGGVAGVERSAVQ